MKYVICYALTDGCTYHCDTTVPCEYDEGMFSADFEQLLLSELARNRKARAIQDAYQETMPVVKAVMTDKEQEELSVWFDGRPEDKPIDSFYFAGHMWPLDSFVLTREDLDKEHPRLKLPEVYSVEEWFEKHKRTA